MSKYFNKIFVVSQAPNIKNRKVKHHKLQVTKYCSKKQCCDDSTTECSTSESSYCPIIFLTEFLKRITIRI